MQTAAATMSWLLVLEEIRRLTTRLRRERATTVETTTETVVDDGTLRFTVLVAGRSSMVLRLRSDHLVECHWRIADAVSWSARYQIDVDGAWHGASADSGEPRRHVGAYLIAQVIVGVWLAAAAPPGHESPLDGPRPFPVVYTRR